jgi:hypothetical protein
VPFFRRLLARLRAALGASTFAPTTGDAVRAAAARRTLERASTEIGDSMRVL